MSKQPENGRDGLPDKITEVLLEATAPIDPGPERAARMREQLLDRVRTASAPSQQPLLTVPGGDEDWLEAAPGNSVKILRSDEESMSMLVRLEPGATFPRHSHPADEETFVLEGETWFGDIHLVAGDYHLAPQGTEHGEVRTETGCLLFIRKASD